MFWCYQLFRNWWSGSRSGYNGPLYFLEFILPNHLRTTFLHPFWESSVHSAYVNVNAIADELVHEMRGRMQHSTRFTSIQNKHVCLVGRMWMSAAGNVWFMAEMNMWSSSLRIWSPLNSISLYWSSLWTSSGITRFYELHARLYPQVNRDRNICRNKILTIFVPHKFV